jgi:uncharacterized repeat protein (TIGR01451 family)
MNFFSLLPFVRPGMRPLRKPAPSPQPPARHTPLLLEILEDRCLPSCATISGFVFYDANNNGLFDPGEKPIANNAIELHNANNVVVGRAVTDASGYYAFSTDSTIDISPKTQTFSLAFPENKTNQSQTGQVPQFNPALGTLTAIDLVVTGQIASDIKVENQDPSPVKITGVVSGTIGLSGADFTGLVTTSSTSKSFSASAWDGVNDFAGTSGKDFGAATVPGSSTFHLTSTQALADYTGTGSVTITETAQATSAANGGGNLLVKISSTGSAKLTVVYHYIPNNCLRPGNYTIVQPTEPPGYLNGKDSRGGVVLPPGPLPDTIPVTLAGSDLPNNDFGELLPSADLSVVKADSPDPVNVKATLTYTLSVGNAGPTPASGVMVKDTLPPGVTFVSASGPGWSVTQAGGVVTATMPGMAVGASSVITITVKAPANPGTITNTATVSSNTPDNNPGNNTSSVTTQVVSPTILLSPDVFPPPSATFPSPSDLTFLSKVQFLAVGGSGTIDPVLLAQATYVEGLYQTLLGRPSDLAGLVNWVRFLRGGGSMAQVVQALWTSDEHRGLQVDSFYQTFLHQNPDPGGRAYWVSVFRAGASEADVARMIFAIGSQANGTSAGDFISALYQDILNRPVDAAGLAYWQQVLQSGVSRDAVIRLIMNSDEANLLVINGNYLNILHRPADAASQQFWLGLMRSGRATAGTLSQALLASGEFFNLAVIASQS